MKGSRGVTLHQASVLVLLGGRVQPISVCACECHPEYCGMGTYHNDAVRSWLEQTKQKQHRFHPIQRRFFKELINVRARRAA